ncbi:hypothetical protein K501DRAFT_267220 [Backusella circina FSU 941]|nr:hypothetical protein K501DRAFT_267220 [Backusella circina FSU 941]
MCFVVILIVAAITSRVTPYSINNTICILNCPFKWFIRGPEPRSYTIHTERHNIMCLVNVNEEREASDVKYKFKTLSFEETKIQLIRVSGGSPIYVTISPESEHDDWLDFDLERTVDNRSGSRSGWILTYKT